MKFPFYRFLLVVLCLSSAFSTPLFAWPFGNSKKTEKKSPSPALVSSQKTQTPAPVKMTDAPQKTQDDLFFDEEPQGTDEEVSSEAPLIPVIPSIPKTSIPTIPDLPQTKFASAAPSLPKLSPPVNPSAAAGLDPDILRIQKQIQEIMKINESLKNNFKGQAAEIQKISDQAKIHGEILKDLDASKKTVQDASAEKYINKEKLRLIKEETEKSQKYLQELNSSKKGVLANASDVLPDNSN